MLLRRLGVLVALLSLASQVYCRPVVALITDFGIENEAVGLCHGAIASVSTDIEVIDYSHAVQAYDIQQASLMLKRGTVFPKGTVFVAVVDPGVGTERDPVAIETKAGYYFVGPNNGVFTHVLKDQGGVRAVAIEGKKVNPNWAPGTFDGRDLFSPAGAKIAASNGKLEEIGTSISLESLIKLHVTEAKVDGGTVLGQYIRTDEPYGNVWTNIEPKQLKEAGLKEGDVLEVEIGNEKLTMPWVISFGYVKEGENLAYLGSGGSLSFAVNMGDFRKKYKLESGAKVVVRKAEQKHP